MHTTETTTNEVLAKYHAMILRVRSEYMRTLEEECICTQQVRKPEICNMCSFVSSRFAANERIESEFSRVRKEQAKAKADPEFLRMLEEEAMVLGEVHITASAS
jgi:hypothetical protein